MCRDSHSALQGIPSVWLSNSFMAEGSHWACQPALFWSVCLISQFTRCFIGTYYGRHGDAIRFTVSWSEGRVYNKWKNTHKQMNTKAHKTHSCCGKVLCPSLPSASLFIRPTAYLHSLWNMDRPAPNCLFSFHIWSWSEASWSPGLWAY